MLKNLERSVISGLKFLASDVLSYKRRHVWPVYSLREFHGRTRSSKMDCHSVIVYFLDHPEAERRFSGLDAVVRNAQPFESVWIPIVQEVSMYKEPS